MKRITWLSVLVLSLAAVASPGAAFEQILTLQEHLGYGWSNDIVHQPVTIPASADLQAEKTALFRDGQAVPMQLDNIETNKAGSILKADVWFRTDLPANGSRSFVLKSGKGATDTDLKITKNGDILEIANALTAVRISGGTNGPLLGVRLASGQWAGASQITCDKALESASTEVLAQGPIFVRTRTTYRFADDGSYIFEATLRSGEPVVRFDETYEKAGSLVLDLSTGLQPTKFGTKADFRGNMQLTPIDYEKSAKLPGLVGWDFYLPNLTSVIGYLGGPNDDLLGWVATEKSAADWLPDPYKQTFAVTAAPGGKLRAEGSLEHGRRTWAFLIAKGSDFPEMPPGTPANPGKDLYRWWSRHIMVSLDKVANWQLVWPDMDKIAFPHTYFSSNDLPGIRTRLQAEPAIREFMEKAKTSNAIFKDIPFLSSGYLYFGDPAYLKMLDSKPGDGSQTPREYLDFFIRCYLDGAGPLWREGSGGDGGNMGSMNVSDQMLLRCVGFELLLGSDVLSPTEKRDFLAKLAFMTYVMHDPAWQPPVHMPDGSRPGGYGQGTPNQKHCAFSVRAMTACMLANHPMKKEWMRFAMAELRPHYEYTIHESGALLESPFYSSRDTMRYAPFWSAMTRAGVAEVAPDYEKWMNRPKLAFQYLANMLTPKEPRMGGKRVYHPIGRSSPGVVDPTLMIGGDPWGLTDPRHGALMRWGWQEQGKPSPDIMGSTGGRNLALTLIAASHAFEPLKDNPLRSRRFEGMGAIFRSHPESDYESNILFRHDGFCWDLYAVNNGAVYFYGKGAPLLPRFGAYWSHSYGGAWMMDMPFGNRVDFAGGNNNCSGSVTEFAALGPLADLSTGITDDKDWRRSVLFAKDLDREDPVYLLVRDDVSRSNTASALNWWIMTRNVQPDGLTKPGVVPIKISHADWVSNMGHNWENAAKTLLAPPASPDEAAIDVEALMEARKPPKLTGQFHNFPGMCGVDLDLFIAVPADPSIVVDAASAGNFPYCQGPKDLFETQELLRISQSPGKGYMTLLMPRWPGAPQPECRTIAEGAGVSIKHAGGEDRLFLSDTPVSFKDAVATFKGRAGFVRHGPAGTLRLMVTDGRIESDGLSLSCPGSAALAFDGKTVQAYSTSDPKTVVITLPNNLKNIPVKIIP